MLLDIKSSVLLGLLAVSSAAAPVNSSAPAHHEPSPIVPGNGTVHHAPHPYPIWQNENPALQARAPVVDVTCSRNGQSKTFTAEQIQATLTEAKGGKKGKYPYPFKNQGSDDGTVFRAVKGATNLVEYPLMNPVWAGNGEPGKYRVVYNSKSGTYTGVMQKAGGDTYVAC